MKALIFTILSLILVFGATRETFAIVASSTNYILERDSINFAGARSTSTNFDLEDTAGEIGTGRGTSTNYILEAGYQQAVGFVAISAPADISLSPAITTLQGGAANGTVSWTVTTDNPGGYVLYAKAGAAPAMRSGANSFADYTIATSDPDFSWSVGVGAAEFGFSPEGSDVYSTYKDNGVSCNTGSLETTGACWDAFTTSNKLIADGPSNNPTGATTTLRLRAEAGSSASQPAGSYSAQLTLTALAI